jgi:hypothetical protein
MSVVAVSKVAFATEVNDMAEYQLIPSKTALVNVDMQNAFVEVRRCPHPTASLCCPWSTAWPPPAETPG